MIHILVPDHSFPSVMKSDDFSLYLCIYFGMFFICAFRKLRKQPQIIFINITLIALYIAFIISTLAEQFDSHGTAGQRICCLFSAVLQYCMLSYFLWTAAEAVILMMMARNNFKIPNKFFIFSPLTCFSE